MKDIILRMNDSAEVRDAINLSSEEKRNIAQRIHAGVKKTRIKITNLDTGETNVYENKVVIPGSQMNICKMFGLEEKVKFPSYNKEMDLDNSVDPEEPPANDQLVCLFCLADSGCGTLPKDVYVSKVTDRIKPAPANPTSIEEFTPEMIMPFRYVDYDHDLNANLRKYYFGRKTFTSLGKIGYYFKTFDTEPQLHLQYADGTEITENMWNVESDQEAECYVEMRLRITRLDFRDYFENVLGWDKSRISSLSLCTAWYNEGDDGFTYFQNILPYTILNFSYQLLVSSETAIDIQYELYY